MGFQRPEILFLSECPQQLGPCKNKGIKKCCRFRVSCRQNYLNTQVSLFWWLQPGVDLQKLCMNHLVCPLLHFLLVIELLCEAFHSATPKHGYLSGLCTSAL